MKRSKYANAYNSRNPTKAHDLIFLKCKKCSDFKDSRGIQFLNEYEKWKFLKKFYN